MAVHLTRLLAAKQSLANLMKISQFTQVGFFSVTFVNEILKNDNILSNTYLICSSSYPRSYSFGKFYAAQCKSHQ
jgi:hypothetical protein